MKVYLVLSHEAIDGECADDFAAFKTYEDAKVAFNERLDMARDPENKGMIFLLKQKGGPYFWEPKIGEYTDFYECWIESDYARNHYKLTLESWKI